MRPAFNIQTTQSTQLPTKLLMLVSFQQVSFITIGGNNQLYSLVAYHFPVEIGSNQLKTYIEEIFAELSILRNTFEKVNIIYNFPSSVIVPHEFFNESANKEMLELVYGYAESNLIKTDFMYHHNLHNVYSTPAVLHSYFTDVFPSATHTHLYSLLPETIHFNNDHLYCIFGSNDITLMLLKNKQLQVVQQFIYKTPEDVVYQLLNICSNFTVDPEDTVVHLNGMIDESSNLYKELYKYFAILQFETLPTNFTYPSELENYPNHYFSHLFAIASCV